MGRTKLMRAPLKYVQEKTACSISTEIPAN